MEEDALADPVLRIIGARSFHAEGGKRWHAWSASCPNECPGLAVLLWCRSFKSTRYTNDKEQEMSRPVSCGRATWSRRRKRYAVHAIQRCLATQIESAKYLARFARRTCAVRSSIFVGRRNPPCAIGTSIGLTDVCQRRSFDDKPVSVRHYASPVPAI